MFNSDTASLLEVVTDGLKSTEVYKTILRKTSQHNWTTIKEYEDIRFEFFEGTQRLQCRPKVYNAFRPETNIEMIDAMDIARKK